MDAPYEGVAYVPTGLSQGTDCSRIGPPDSVADRVRFFYRVRRHRPTTRRRASARPGTAVKATGEKRNKEGLARLRHRPDYSPSSTDWRR